jgi:miniconductance mechanosensitive channel
MEEKFQQLLMYITSIFSNDLVIADTAIPAYIFKMLLLVIITVLFHVIASKVVMPLVGKLIQKTKSKIAKPNVKTSIVTKIIIEDILFKRKAFQRTLHLITATIISVGYPIILPNDSEIFIIISKIMSLYFILIAVSILDALLGTVHDLYEEYAKSKKVGITGAIQALKVLGVIIAIILAISVLAGKSPVYFLSGLGAFTAILMLIFKDPILGLVSGVQLSALDLVRKGDWIEIPKHGADGAVVEITLTTVKVRNWDLTFTAIPAYELIASSFKNWRGMFESGGRRIKRSMRFSARSIRFLTDEEIGKLQKIKLLTPYMNGKIAELHNYNTEVFTADDMTLQTNGRRLTNIGTYRAYCDAYIRSHPGINKNLIIMVRQLHPTEFGLPLEIYAYTSDVTWAGHENTQSDIFDHLISIVSEFGLELYQR